MTRRNRTAAAWAAWVLAFGFAVPAQAQVFRGGIDASILGPTGEPVPGARVDLSGPASLAQEADPKGRAHFRNLPVGIYTVKVSLTNFTSSTYSNVEVLSNANTWLVVHLVSVTGASEAINARLIVPIADVTRDTTTTHVIAQELQDVPSARDPWVVLQTVPTIYVDRVNVGGSESTEQSDYNAKGAKGTDNTWSLDGVPVTDMGSSAAQPALVSGSSALFYDFDSIEDLAVTTGGADAQNATGGVGVNLVLKKGLDAPHGSVRGYFENQSLESANISSALATSLGDTTGVGSRVDFYHDYGAELGGPLLKDVVWIWGTFTWTGIDLLTATGLPDNTRFKNYALKADGKLNDKVRGNATFYENNKAKDSAAVGPLRPVLTAWSQDDPTRYFKGEGTFVVGGRLFASARGAYISGGFDLTPVGGLSTDYYIDDALVAHNWYYEYKSSRPQHYYGGDASYFAGPHEIRFGGGWRSTPIDTQQIWPASHLVANWNGYPNILVQAARDYRAVTRAKYVNAFVTDTISLGRLTVTGGIRFDRQSSSLGAASVPGVAGIPILPALNAPAVDSVFNWSNVTPRAGLTLALDADRKSIVRASYAMYASQLPGSEASFVSPIQYSYVYYNAVDRNGDGASQLSEILFNQGLQGYSGFDPNNPARLSSVNTVDPNVKAPITHEMLIGFDRELMPDFGVSATYTYRRMVDLLWTPLTGVTSSDYTQTGTLSGTLPEIGSYNVPLYALNASAVPPGGGLTETNRPGYHQRYRGFEISATKRLSHRWMARFAFSTNEWREYFDNPSQSILDPTPAPSPSPSRPFAGPQINGGVVLQASAGNGQSTIYMVAPSYQIAASGLFEVFWGVSIGANVVARPGYAEPFFESNVATGDPLGHKTVLLVPTVDAFRLPSVTSLDGRVEKKFVFLGAKLAVDFDVFNVLNAGTVLGEQYDARATGATGFGQTLQVMNPRIARLGVRLVF